MYQITRRALQCSWLPHSCPPVNLRNLTTNTCFKIFDHVSIHSLPAETAHDFSKCTSDTWVASCLAIVHVLQNLHLVSSLRETQSSSCPLDIPQILCGSCGKVVPCSSALVTFTVNLCSASCNNSNVQSPCSLNGLYNFFFIFLYFVCARAHVLAPARVRAFACARVCWRACVCVCVRVHVCLHARVCTYMHATLHYLQPCSSAALGCHLLCVHVCVRVHVCLPARVCMYVHATLHCLQHFSSAALGCHPLTCITGLFLHRRSARRRLLLAVFETAHLHSTICGPACA